MDVRKTRPVSGVSPVTRVVPWTGVSGVQTAQPATGVPVDQIRDVVSLGIPASEMTPRVQQAVLGLLGMVDRLRRELDESRKRLDDLERLADEDTLLPIANRRAFMRELARMVGMAERYGTPGSIAYFDVNGFKPINDEFGHAAGDAALVHVARILVACVRSGDMVGRLGGDEFGVLLVQTEAGQARLKAEELAAEISAQPLLWQGKEIGLSTSWGVYCFNGLEDAAQVLDAADRAMYQNKKRRE